MGLTVISEDMQFSDRREAGKKLAEHLESMDLENPAVVGIPRGGVVVAAEIADRLSWPLDICLVRKLGAPRNPELAIGSILEGGYRYINDQVVSHVGADQDYIEREVEKQRQELQRRAERYRGVKPRVDLEDRTVVVADDGIATGATMMSALQAMDGIDTRAVVAAVPCAPRDRIRIVADACDEVLCLTAARVFGAISQFYGRFGQVSDDEVLEILQGFGD